MGHGAWKKGEHPKCVNLFFCSDGSLACFLDIREQDAPTTNLLRAKLGCSRFKVSLLVGERNRSEVFQIRVKSQVSLSSHFSILRMKQNKAEYKLY